jgi:hypothetical protein
MLRHPCGEGEKNGEEERECVMRAGIVEKHSRAMTYRGVWPRIGESKAKQSKARQNKTKQNKTKQSKAKQKKTKQNKAEEGKAKEDCSWF